jgi:cAMP phosphodiesterase
MRRTDHASFKDIEFFQDTRLSVIDKILFAEYHSVLVKISDNLKEFTECQKYIYGKHAICFLGDFCQLEAIGGDCIYKNRNRIYREQALNCMVELKGTHCFNDCNDMKVMMPNKRDGVLSTEERNTINFRVINENKVKKPKSVKNQICHIATTTQKDRISTQVSFEII